MMVKSIPHPASSASYLLRRSLIETQDGTTLFFQDWGTGKPVIFIHG